VTTVLQTVEISKRYGTVQALTSISIEIAAGATTILIGRNGAGKSTLLEIVVGIRRPTSGIVQLFGENIGEQSADVWRKQIGYLPQEVPVVEYSTGLEYLELLAELYGISPAAFARDLPSTLEQFGLADCIQARMGSYSVGTRKKLACCALAVCQPPLLVLDEPFEGLDPYGIRRLQGWIRAVTARGQSVLLSSHLLALVEPIADSLVVLDGGTVRYAGPGPGGTDAVAPYRNLEELYFALTTGDRNER
jgi:ABC-2 type transport system ATP-binding protein